MRLITQKAIQRGSFSRVKKLISKIEQFMAANQDQGAAQVDLYSGLKPGETPETLLANLRDDTLVRIKLKWPA